MKNIHRPNLHQYFFQIIDAVASRSTCLHRSVGAIIVKDGRIISTGYNGVPSGLPHCEDAGCHKPVSGKELTSCKAAHAEMNAIVFAARHGTAIDGSTMYCNLLPCSECSKYIINSGIAHVIYKEDYSDHRGLDMMKLAGIEVTQYINDV